MFCQLWMFTGEVNIPFLQKETLFTVQKHQQHTWCVYFIDNVFSVKRFP